MEVARAPGMTLDRAIAALRLDRRVRIVDVTPEAASVLGFRPHDLHGLTLSDLAAEQWSALADGATARILVGDTRSFQLMLRGKSGRRTLLEMVSKPVEENGEVSYVLAWSEQLPIRGFESTESSVPELRRLAKGRLRTREVERSRVATELHDEVASLVVIAKFMIEDGMRRISDGKQADGFDQLNGAVGRLRDVLDEVRRISTELRPSLLNDLGLLPTIEWLCRTFEQTCRSVRIERQTAVMEIDVPENLKLVIFRTLEELLRNVAQHANATRVCISLVREANELFLSVEDDGDGFDTALLGEGAHHIRGIGLRSIREGLQTTGGRFALDSKPNKGARIGARWPLPARGAAR